MMSYIDKKKHTKQLWKCIFIVYTVVLFFLSPEKTPYGMSCLLTYVDLFLGVAVFWENEDVRVSNGVFLFWVISFIFSFG